MRVMYFSPVWQVNRREPVQRRRASWLACLAALAAALLGCVLPQAASAEEPSPSAEAETYSVCPAKPGVYECLVEAEPLALTLSGIRPEVSPALEGGGELKGLDPENLKSAYKLPATGGSGETIAIVDAYNDPNAESDLQKYREKYKVYYNATEKVTACTEANGCFKKLNQKGENKNYPSNNVGWSLEISLDLDMASAVCPECHIDLVEANKEGNELDVSEEAAASLKPAVISNSWGRAEESAQTERDVYFHHPGIPVVAAVGDDGYKVGYPAASPDVIAAGGTTLKKAENARGWTESVWTGTGSGCSKYEEKPPWQTDKACTDRTDNDVAADASEESPVSVYDSYEYPGWEDVWGTSAATPIISGIEAQASSATRTLTADAFYKKPSMLFHVSEGSNGTCTPPAEDEYLCHGTKEGYNAPTGQGTPDKVFESVAAAAATGFATKVAGTEATVSGIVNPNGLATKYYVEYGTTKSLGSKTAEVSVGSGTSNLEESKAITGLKGSTKYYFRIVATSSSGTTDGLNEVFTTTVGPPENTALPVISPTTPEQAVAESTSTGTWTNEPTSYAYQWERCNASGGECKEISGATSSSYTPVEADVEHTLVAKVTAKNEAGSNSASSKASGQVRQVPQITEYSLPSESYPLGITAGPDNNVWFTNNTSSKIGKITPSGTVTEYALPAKSGPYGITVGPGKENALWFADHSSGKIGKITTSGTITEYELPTGSSPNWITTGPDGNLWFLESGTKKIGKITTSGTITEYPVSGKLGESTITAGSDGNLWFTEKESDKIGKITTSGTVTEYELPKEREPFNITAGPEKENALWFTEYLQPGKIGKITTSGTITEYSMPTGQWPIGITAGPDKDLWYLARGGSMMGKITPSGTITEYSMPEGSLLGEIAASQESLWTAGLSTNKIDKFTP
jgi:streptogramin lyase